LKPSAITWFVEQCGLATAFVRVGFGNSAAAALLGAEKGAGAFGVAVSSERRLGIALKARVA
jgi:hypothetical protein